MSPFTIELIRENPWNVISHSIPSRPEDGLLELAIIAACYCRSSEHLLMMRALDGSYTPEGWKPGKDSPDVHEECEARWLQAEERLEHLNLLAAKL